MVTSYDDSITCMGYATIPLPTSIGEADGEQFVQAMVTEGLIIINNIEKSVR